jgi:hypothetical protein
MAVSRGWCPSSCLMIDNELPAAIRHVPQPAQVAAGVIIACCCAAGSSSVQAAGGPQQAEGGGQEVRRCSMHRLPQRTCSEHMDAWMPAA